jgi:hypothetical protein
MAAPREILFRTDPPVMSSILIEKKLRFELKWKKWKPRTITIDSNGVLEYRTKKNVGGFMDIKVAFASYMPEEILLAILDHEKLNKFTGITVKCKTLEGYDTYIRCILENEQFENFRSTIAGSSPRNNLDKLGPIPQFAPDVVERHAVSGPQKNMSKSVMRRAVTLAMNTFDVRSRRDQIICKRGALRWLPVLFDNDLIHGSWYAHNPLLYCSCVSVNAFLFAFG